VELLEAMDESAVAKRAGELIKHSLSVVKSTTVTEDVNISSLYSGNSPLDPFVPQDPEEEMAYSVCAFCTCLCFGLCVNFFYCSLYFKILSSQSFSGKMWCMIFDTA
jgi:hypothetical protein